MMNHAYIIGRITHELEIKKLKSGNAVSFQIASERTGSADGTQATGTDFIPISALGSVCDQMLTYGLKKGSLISINGPLRIRSWEQNGTRRYKTYLEASEIAPFQPASSKATSLNDAPPVDHDIIPEEYNPF